MAWAHVGPSHVNASTTAGSTYGIIGSGTSLDGGVAVLVCATDNITTTDGNTNNHTSVTTSSGETWTKVYEYTNGQGSAAAGATVSVWYAEIPAGQTSFTSVALNLSGSVAKHASIVGQFSRTSSTAVVSSVGTPQVLANDGADPGSMTLGSLANAEHLWVRGIAAESNTDTYLTASAGGWTSVVGAPGSHSTSGGGGAANIAAGMEWLLATGTTATSDPSWVSVDMASVLIALDETPAAASVPRFTSYPQLLAH